jgi:hypothetical protein
MHNAPRPSRSCAIALLLLLAGCAAFRTGTPVPGPLPALAVALPLTLHIERREGDRQADWLLLLQREDDALRWSLFDPLGQPLARQLLHADGWQRDGLLPPNAEAVALFAAVLFALTPEPALAASYEAAQWSRQADGSRRLAPDWQIAYGGAPAAAQPGSGAVRQDRDGPYERHREESEPAMRGKAAIPAPAFTLTRSTTLHYRVTSLVSERP